MDGKKKNYERELPEGYKAIYTVDATTKKFTIVMNLVALALMAVIIVPPALVIRPWDNPESISMISLLWFIAAMFAYIVLHELVHGAAYKLTTGQKLSFGFTASVAYCGVPDIYVYRKASLIALLAPFVVFSIVFGAATAIISNPVDKFMCFVLFAIHISGCVGDLYDSLLYLFKFRDPATLMRDTGPVQTFYLK